MSVQYDFVENPMYGGIMTQAPSVGGGVRVDPTTRAPQSFAMRVPEGWSSQLSFQLYQKHLLIPTTPPPPPLPSGLDQVKSLFTRHDEVWFKGFSI
jgi:hypothetical protein